MPVRLVRVIRFGLFNSSSSVRILWLVRLNINLTKVTRNKVWFGSRLVFYFLNSMVLIFFLLFFIIIFILIIILFISMMLIEEIILNENELRSLFPPSPQHHPIPQHHQHQPHTQQNISISPKNASVDTTLFKKIQTRSAPIPDRTIIIFFCNIQIHRLINRCGVTTTIGRAHQIDSWYTLTCGVLKG